MPDAPPRRDPAAPPVALLLLTRDPGGRLSGRKTVLATIASSLEALGFAVHAVVLARTPPEPTWHGRPVHHVSLPGRPRVAAPATGVVLGRRSTLNESLFDSPAVRRRTAQLAQELQASVVVADAVRTTGPAFATGAPVVVHLDDLLSDRYAAMAEGTADGDVLGFFAEQLPRPVVPLARAGARRLVRLEARRVGARERVVARAAHAVATTSQDEADELVRRSGRPVAALPMAIDVRQPGAPAAAPATSFVFLGLLDYAPNREALGWWLEHVRPALDALGGEDVVLTVVGHRSGAAGLPVDDPRLRFTGYVEDLAEELRRHRAMVAPVRSGAGVKTKVLDAWSVGLPVVATRAGSAGLRAEDGGLVVADDPAGFARAVLTLRDDAQQAERLGRSGWDVLARDWSGDALVTRWRDALGPLGVLPPSG